MIGLVRIAGVLKAVEPRHWVGLGASVALHLAVLLGWQPEPPPEPKPISFEIALEPPIAKTLPEAKTKAVAKKSRAKKLAKQRKAKAQKVAAKEPAKKEIAKREPHVLDATWRGETKASPDAPALALPDARALGLAAGSQAETREFAQVSGKPQLGRVDRVAQAATSAAANEGNAGLSEPGTGQVGADSAPRGETGLALASSTALSANQAVNPGTNGAGAQANTSAASLAGVTGGVRGGEGQAGLHASAAPQAALSAPAGAGIQAASATATAMAAPAAQAGAEPQGVRLTASGAVARLAAALPAGAGSLALGPPAGAAAQAAPQQATTNQPAAGAAGGVLVSSQAGAASGPINAGARSGSAQAGGVEAGASRGGRGQEAKGRLGVATVVPTALMSSARVAGAAGQGRQAAALAPGEPGSSPRFAVTLQPVLANLPASNPYLPARPGQAGAGASGEPAAAVSRAAPSAAADVGARGGAAMQFAGSAAGAGPASASGRAPNAAARAGGVIAAPGPAGSAAVLNAAREAGRAPVVLQAAQPLAVKVVRPDSEIQRLDVLAPSNYCPLPFPGHHQPDNRAPPPDRNIAEQPAYALDNPPIDYPFLANIRSVEGRVTVRVEVLADGHPGKMWLKQSSGSGILDNNAQDQLKHWRFVPARKNGQPVSAWIDVPVLYRLSEANNPTR